MAIEYQIKQPEDVCGVGNVVRDETSATKFLLSKRTKFWDAIDRLRQLPPGVERRPIYTRLDRLARNMEDADNHHRPLPRGHHFSGPR